MRCERCKDYGVIAVGLELEACPECGEGRMQKGDEVVYTAAHLAQLGYGQFGEAAARKGLVLGHEGRWLRVIWYGDTESVCVSPEALARVGELNACEVGTVSRGKRQVAHGVRPLAPHAKPIAKCGESDLGFAYHRELGTYIRRCPDADCRWCGGGQ